MFPFFDPSMIFLLPALAFAFYAQFKVKSTYEKYAKIKSSRGMSGADAAKQMIVNNGLSVSVEVQPGVLTDHYDPRSKKLKLSYEVYNSNSLSALGIAAHEVGHAIQDRNGYFPMQIRSSIVPAANIGSQLAIPLFFIGFFFRSAGILMDIGILLFSLAVLFHIITLPVEFNASRLALANLQGNKFLSDEELEGSRKVLNAAALTYVAATAMAAMQLIRLLILRNRRD
ncbi:MAG: zinc metallopeptidase [bacterium]|nr:zinc metallopeptidase [bacterium]